MMPATAQAGDYTTRSNQMKLPLTLLLAATPVLMAVLPWDFGKNLPLFRAFVLTFSLPVILIEFIVIMVAFQRQFSPFSAIASLPLGVRAGLGLLLAIALGTTAFVAHTPVISLLCGLFWLNHFLFGLSIAHLVRQDDVHISLQHWALIAGGIIAYILMLSLFLLFLPDHANFHWTYSLPGITHVRHIGYFGIAGYLAAFALASQHTSKRVYWIGIIFAIGGIGLVMWSGTRGAIFAVAVAVFTALICFHQFRTRKIAAWLPLTTIGGIALSLIYIPPSNAYGIFRIVKSSGTLDPYTLSSSRTELWAATARKIVERPLFGYGEREFTHVVLKDEQTLRQPHNVFLQIALQWGLLGAACFFSMVAMLCAAFYRKAVRIGEEAIPAFLIVTAILVYSLYDAALFYPYPIMMAVFCIAAILGRPDKDASPLPVDHRD